MVKDGQLVGEMGFSIFQLEEFRAKLPLPE